MIPVGYNLRSLAVRRTTTLATVFGIGLVVFVLASTLMLSAGVEATLTRGGGKDKAIVVRKGSDGELASTIEQAQLGVLLATPGVKKDEKGNPIGVGEVSMIMGLAPNADPTGISNVQIRGVPSDVAGYRPALKIVEGRMFNPGTDEAIVGKAIDGRFVGLQVGGQVEPRKNRPLKIVGAFEVGGAQHESEVWADVETVKASFGREAMLSSVRVQLESEAAFEGYKAAVEADKRLGLEVFTEDGWNEKQSQFLSVFISALGIVISVFFAFGAMIGAMITMYSSVATRQREIGTLRAIGFPRWQILLSFVLESFVISILGGALGCVGALGMGFVKFSTLNFATSSEVVFTFTPTPTVFIASFVFAGVMGVAGGLFPAIRAARLSPVTAMRG